MLVKHTALSGPFCQASFQTLYPVRPGRLCYNQGKGKTMVQISQLCPRDIPPWSPRNLNVMARARLKNCQPQDCQPQDCQHKGALGCTLSYIVRDGNQCVSCHKR